MQNQLAEQTRTRPRARVWEAAFLSALRRAANVSEAATAAGIGRTTAYEARQRDKPFSDRWDAAIEEACDALEREAWRRAVEGVEEAVFQQGVEVGRVRKYSDSLMIALLKAHRPEKYRERHDHRHEHDGEFRAAGTSPEEARQHILKMLQRFVGTEGNLS